MSSTSSFMSLDDVVLNTQRSLAATKDLVDQSGVSILTAVFPPIVEILNKIEVLRNTSESDAAKMVCEEIDKILSQVFGAAKIVINRTSRYPPGSPEVKQLISAAQGAIFERVVLLVLDLKSIEADAQRLNPSKGGKFFGGKRAAGMLASLKDKLLKRSISSS